MTDITICELCKAEVEIPALVLVGMQTMFVCNTCDDMLYDADPAAAEAFGFEVIASLTSAALA